MFTLVNEWLKTVQSSEKTHVSLKNQDLIKIFKCTLDADPEMRLWIKIIWGTF